MKKSVDDSRQFRKKDIEEEVSSVAEGVKITEQQPRDRRSMKKIDTGGGAYIGGEVSTGGGDFVGRDQIVYGDKDRGRELAAAFHDLFTILEKMEDGPRKRMAETAVEGLREEAEKGDAADESHVREYFDLLKMAPDVFEVAVATFVNPIQGLSLVFKKIADKAKTG